MQVSTIIQGNTSISSEPGMPHLYPLIPLMMAADISQNSKKDGLEDLKCEKLELKYKYEKLSQQSYFFKEEEISIFQQRTQLLCEMNGMLKNYILKPQPSHAELGCQASGPQELPEELPEELHVGLVDHCQESRETERCSLTSFQKNQQNAKLEVKSTEMCRSQISTDNIIDVLNSPSYKRLKKTKGYENRKRIIDLQQKYKQILLQKYGLKQLNLLAKQIDKEDKQTMKRYRKQNKQKKQGCIASMSARKLLIMLTKNMKIGSTEAKQIINSAFQGKTSENTKSKKDLCRVYRNIFKEVCQNCLNLVPNMRNGQNQIQLCLEGFNSSEVIGKE